MSIDNAPSPRAAGQLELPVTEVEPAGDDTGSSDALRAYTAAAEAAEADYSQPYASSFDIYWRAGWRGVLPLPKGLKASPPVTAFPDGTKRHWTGGKAQSYPSYADLMCWSEDKPGGNVAIRAPETVVMLDVDVYGAKRGDLALRELIEALGPLPATWHSTSRGDGATASPLGVGLYATGQYAFRVPAGSYFKGEAAKSIEIIQSTHRYMVAWPSTNPDNHGRRYRWYRPDGSLAPEGEVPRVDELPELPATWLEALKSGTPRAIGAELLDEDRTAYLRQFRMGLACGRLVNMREKAAREMLAGGGSAHTVAMRTVRALIMCGAEGHCLGSGSMEKHGTGSPIDQIYHLERAFVATVTNPARGNGVRDTESAKAEFRRLVDGAVDLAAAAIPAPSHQDPECLDGFMDGFAEWVGPIEAPGTVGAVPASLAPQAEYDADETHAETVITAAEDPNFEEWPLELDGHEAPGAQRRGREPLDVTNPAIAAEWLVETVGRGALAGVFRRGAADVIVHTPTIGQDGYRPPANHEDSDGPAQVQPIDAVKLAAKVQFAFACTRTREARKDDPEERITTLTNGRKVVKSPAMFPVDAARAALAAEDMLQHIRRLAGVVHVPAIRKDGTLLATAGYDVASRLLHLPEPGLIVPAVPEKPTEAQIAEARNLLMKMVADFPFVTTHDRAAYFGLLLTPLLRLITPAPYKMFAISAHQAGSGKTLLATLARIIHGGVFRSELPEDDAELRKQITAILMTTTGPVINIDNVTGIVRSSTLAGLLTSKDWDDRKLGENDLARCENDRVWVLTGNNMALGGDLARRTIWINIDPGRPDPQLRTGFTIEDIEDWTRQHRGELISALLTLVRAWVSAGRPGKRASSDGYGRWLAAVNGILEVAGINGACDEPEARGQAEGDEDAEWATLLEAIHGVFGAGKWSAKAVLERVNTGNADANDYLANGVIGMPLGAGKPIRLEQLPEALAEKLLKSGGNVMALGRSLGRWLMNRKGRWAGGLTVREHSKDKYCTYWFIEKYEPKTDI